MRSSALLLLLPSLALLAGCVSRASHGSPVGPSVRIGNEIGTLIATAAPHTIYLFGNPRTDNNSVALFLYPSGRIIPVGEKLPATGFEHATQLLGADDRYLWFYANGIGAWDSRSGRLIRSADLRRANPALRDLPGVDNSNDPLIAPEARRPLATNDDIWDGDPRRFSFATRLRVRTPDYKQVLEVDPATLQAAPATGEEAPEPRPRLTPELAEIWTKTTGVPRSGVEQVLPGDGWTALRGVKPNRDGVMGEPLLVWIQEKGKVATTTLWK